MLQFFRKHQKYFFLFTTVIIVLSFAFFGTYQAVAPMFQKNCDDETAFVSLGNKKIKRSYLNQMSAFLSREEWMQTPQIFDVNFYNDGVISKEFLEGGILDSMLLFSGPQFAEALEERRGREQNFTPYRHPYLPVVSAEMVWSLFAPSIPEQLAALQASDSVDFKKRVDLFLSEKQFPPFFLTQMLQQQERENPRFPPDPRLTKDVVTLFGYHDLGDWFGKRFLDCASEIIINTAALARSKGYRVTREEALTELLYKSQKTYDMLNSYVKLPMEDGGGFFSRYLRTHGMDEATLVQIWSDILLFRRMLEEVGSVALVDQLPIEQFYGYAGEKVAIELYQMVPELRFQTAAELGYFENYLALVAGPKKDPLDVPSDFAPFEEIKQRAPELIGKRYHFYVGSISTEALQAKVSVKETWAWERDPSHKSELEKAFPQLTNSSLDDIDSRARQKIDAFARAQIVADHPEWIDEALANVSMKEKEIFLTQKTEEPLPGISDSLRLVQLFDSEDEVAKYTQDERHYYRFIIDERSEAEEILTFKAAQKMGLLSAQESELIPSTRFKTFLEAHKHSLPEGELSKQWGIEKNERLISRSKPGLVSVEHLLTLNEGTISSVAVDEKEGAYYYRVVNKSIDTTVPVEKWREVQALLAGEARGLFIHSVMEKIEERGASSWK